MGACRENRPSESAAQPAFIALRNIDRMLWLNQHDPQDLLEEYRLLCGSLNTAINLYTEEKRNAR